MSDDAGGREAASLRRTTLRSTYWVSILQTLQGVALFAVPAIATHLLRPDEMGMVEIALSFLGVSLLLVELGSIPAIVHHADLTPRYLATVLALNLGTAVVLGGVLLVVAPAAAHALGADGRLTWVVRAIGCALPVVALTIVPRALLVRRMDFRRLTQLGVGAAAAGLAVAGATFLGGLGGVALAWGMAAFLVFYVAGAWAAAGFLPRAAPDRRELAGLLGFSLKASAARTVDSFNWQIEKLLIAGLLGPSDLGIYAVARNLTRGSLRRLMSVSDIVLLPGLSRLGRDRAAARSYYLAAVRYELLLFGPAVVFLGVFAGDVVALVYGAGWERAALVIQLLLPLSWRVITNHSIGAVFLSQGRPDVQLRWAVYGVGLSAVYVLAGCPWGIAGVAVSLSLLGVATWTISHTMANRLLDLPFARFLAAVSGLLGIHALLALVLAALRLASAPLAATHPAWRLVLAAPVAIALYAGLLFVLAPVLARRFVRVLRAVVSEGQASAAGEAVRDETSGGGA